MMSKILLPSEYTELNRVRGKLNNKEYAVAALDESMVVPVARAVSRIWAAGNARVKLFGCTEHDFLPLALDQVLLSMGAGGIGVVVVDVATCSLAALYLSCSFTACNDETRLYLLDETSVLTSACYNYYKTIQTVYAPLKQPLLDYLHRNPSIASSCCYGLKGGVMPSHENQGLMSAVMSAANGLERATGYTGRFGIASNPKTTSYSNQRDLVLGSLRLGDSGVPQYNNDDTEIVLHLADVSQSRPINADAVMKSYGQSRLQQLSNEQRNDLVRRLAIDYNELLKIRGTMSRL